MKQVVLQSAIRVDTHVRWSLLLLGLAGALTVAPAAKAVTCPQNIDLAPPGGSGAADFGKAVAIYSDSYNDYVVVGAPSSNGNTGAVYYFTKSPSATTFGPAILLATGASPGAQFGAAVAMSDGVIVVGSPGYDSGSGPGSGRFDIYEQPRDDAGVPLKGPAPTYAPTQFSATGGWVSYYSQVKVHLGTSVAYDYRSGILTACDTYWGCVQYVKQHANWEVGPGFNYFDTPGSYVVQQSITPMFSYALTRDSAGTSFNVLGFTSGVGYNSIAATFNRAGAWSNFTGMATFIDVALVGEQWGAQTSGVVRTYTKNLLNNPPLSQWQQVADISSASAFGGFGYAVATSGDYAVVTDQETSFGTVHRFRRDYKSTQYDVTDDTWAEEASYGTSSTTYGDALGVHGRCTAIGHPGTNTVHLFSIDNPLPTNVYTDNQSAGITVTVASIGSNGTTTVTVDPSCSTYQDALLNPRTAICTDITTTQDVYGLVTVCFPNTTGQAQSIMRCSDPQGNACAVGNPYPSPTNLKACCIQLPSSSTPTRTCAFTNRFSHFAQSDSFKDTDGDTWTDVVDNCPAVYDISQADSDKDGIGDACDNCPTVPNQNQRDSNGNGVGDACETSQAVPIPRPAIPMLGVSLLALGLVALQRRRVVNT